MANELPIITKAREALAYERECWRSVWDNKPVRDLDEAIVATDTTYTAMADEIGRINDAPDDTLPLIDDEHMRELMVGMSLPDQAEALARVCDENRSPYAASALRNIAAALMKNNGGNNA